MIYYVWIRLLPGVLRPLCSHVKVVAHCGQISVFACSASLPTLASLGTASLWLAETVQFCVSHKSPLFVHSSYFLCFSNSLTLIVISITSAQSPSPITEFTLPSPHTPFYSASLPLSSTSHTLATTAWCSRSASTSTRPETGLFIFSSSSLRSPHSQRCLAAVWTSCALLPFPIDFPLATACTTRFPSAAAASWKFVTRTCS